MRGILESGETWRPVLEQGVFDARGSVDLAQVSHGGTYLPFLYLGGPQ